MISWSGLWTEPEEGAADTTPIAEDPVKEGDIMNYKSSVRSVGCLSPSTSPLIEVGSTWLSQQYLDERS